MKRRLIIALALASSWNAIALADEAPPRAAEAGANPNPLAAIPLSRLTVTRERPLFTASRRPPEASPAAAAPRRPEPVAPPPVAAAEAPPFELVGAIIGDKGRIVLLRKTSSDDVTLLREGEEGQGWRAQKIGPRSVELAKDGTVVTLELPKPNLSPLPAPAGPAP